jgi:hypothetical protein
MKPPQIFRWLRPGLLKRGRLDARPFGLPIQLMQTDGVPGFLVHVDRLGGVIRPHQIEHIGLPDVGGKFLLPFIARLEGADVNTGFDAILAEPLREK